MIVLIIYPVILQTVIDFRIMSTGKQEGGNWHKKTSHREKVLLKSTLPVDPKIHTECH